MKGRAKADNKRVVLPNRDNHEPLSVHKLALSTPQQPALQNQELACELPKSALQ